MKFLILIRVTSRYLQRATDTLFFFFVLGSHLPMSRKLLGDFAALLQSPVKWYNEKKSSQKERLGDQSLGVVRLLLQLRKHRLQCL